MKPFYLAGIEFYPIIGASNYYISRCGQVYSTLSDRLLTSSATSVGYMQCGIILDTGEAKVVKIHSLVAKQFIPNPNNKPTVNHKDRNKENNDVSNLEWATHSEQQQHVLSTGADHQTRGAEHHQFGRKHSEQAKSKMSAEKQGVKHPKFSGYYHTPYGAFASSYEAAAATGEHARSIQRWCKNPAMKTKGWHFEPRIIS